MSSLDFGKTSGVWRGKSKALRQMAMECKNPFRTVFLSLSHDSKDQRSGRGFAAYRGGNRVPELLDGHGF